MKILIPSKQIRWVLAFVVLFTLAIMAAGFWYQRQQKSKKQEQALVTTTVMRGDVLQVIASTGRVVANLDVDIKCKASGEIIKLPYDVSDVVKQGDLLVELNPIDEERFVKQAEESLSAAQAKWQQAQLNLQIAQQDFSTEKKRMEAALKSAKAHQQDAQARWERMKQLLQKKLASQEDSDTVETASIQASTDLDTVKLRAEELKSQTLAIESKRQEILLAKSQVESESVSLSTAQQRLKETRVFSPMSGIVTARTVQVGQIIASGINSVSGGTTILRVSDLSPLFVIAAVDESDIGQVKEGQPVTITADAFPKNSFTGKVVTIAPRGVNTSNVVSFEVKIEVIGDHSQILRPEMTANVSIIIAKSENTLWVSAEALARKQGQYTAQIMRADGSTEERSVKVGIHNGSEVEILDGLTEGDSVVVSKENTESRWKNAPKTSSIKSRPRHPMMP